MTRVKIVDNLMQLRSMSMFVVLLVLSCIRSRGPQIAVPAEFQGTESVIIENKLGRPLCSFRVSEKGDYRSKNWLGRRLGAGERVEVKMKRGRYTVSVGCDGEFYGMADVSIVMKTTIGIGARAGKTKGYAAVTVPVTMRSAGGAQQPAGGADEQSCTGMCGGPENTFGDCCPDEGWHCVIDPQQLRDMGDSATGVCTLK